MAAEEEKEEATEGEQWEEVGEVERGSSGKEEQSR